MTTSSRRPRTAVPLIETKLEAPRRRGGALDRPRIRQALDARAVLTLVGAPAGYGKTTAVRSWCATQDDALAWVTLDAEDNDPTRLWTYVATALDRIHPGLGRAALQRLRVPGNPAESAIDELTAALARHGRPVILVLDDLQTVTDPACMASLDHALFAAPANLRVILSTRMDPPLAIPRLRAAQELIELRAGDLAFTVAEARALLVDRWELELDAEEIDLLVRRTEGWPAALILAGVWLRGASDPSAAVARFGSNQRFVADYLSSEVFAALDEDCRSFLYGAAVLGQCTPEFCDAVLDRHDSADVLAEIERANLLTSRLEHGDWFRIHPLFAEYARAQLEASNPGAATDIHLRAAHWLRAHDRPMEALGHASAAGAHELVAEMLSQGQLEIVRGGGGGTLLRWTRTLPEEVLLSHPDLCAAAAAASLLAAGGTLERSRYVGLVQRAASPSSYARTLSLVLSALALERGVERAIDDADRALQSAGEGVGEIETGALCAQARARYFAGDVAGARRSALRALEHPDISRRVPSLVHARATLALAAVAEDRLLAARTHAEFAKAAIGDLGMGRSWLGANVSAAMGALLAAEGDVVGADRELAAAERFFRDDVPTIHHAWLLAVLARVRLRRGRLDQAQEALRAAREALTELHHAGTIDALVEQVEQDLVQGRARAEAGDVVESPSDAELGVLRLLATDLTLREIGEQLFVSENTIRSHRRALYRKLGAHSRAAAVARGVSLNLLDQTGSPG